jgi:hypothetical protein
MAPNLKRTPAHKRADKARKQREYRERVQKRKEKEDPEEEPGASTLWIESRGEKITHATAQLEIVYIRLSIAWMIESSIPDNDIGMMIVECVSKMLETYVEHVGKLRIDRSGLYYSQLFTANRIYDLSMVAVRQTVYALNHVPYELRVDPDIMSEIMLAAVQENGLALQFVGKLHMDREIVLAAVQQDGFALNYVSNEWKVDPEIMLAAVRQTAYALQFVPLLHMDREIALAAVQQNGLAMKYVGRWNMDDEIALAAVRQNGFAVRHVTLRHSPMDQEIHAIALEAIKSVGR